MEDTPTPDTQSTRRKRGFGRRAMLWTGLPLLAAAGLFATRAWAHGGGCRHRAAKTPEQTRERLQWMVDRALSHVDASDAQRAEAETVVSARAPELHAVHSKGRALRKQLVEALRADDQAELETIRKQGLEVIDRGSALWLSTLHDLSAILEPDQRKALMDRMGHGPFHHMQ